MSNKLDLLKNILLYGLGVAGIVLCILVIGGPNADGTSVAEQTTFREGWKLSSAISFTGILMFACMALVLLFFVVQLITNPKKTIFSIIGILVAAVIYLIMTMVGTSDTNESLALRDPVSDSTISSTTAGLYTVIIGLVISILAILLGPLMGRMRK